MTFVVALLGLLIGGVGFGAFLVYAAGLPQ
jgi:hypothetical protein